MCPRLIETLDWSWAMEWSGRTRQGRTQKCPSNVRVRVKTHLVDLEALISSCMQMERVELGCSYFLLTRRLSGVSEVRAPFWHPIKSKYLTGDGETWGINYVDRLVELEVILEGCGCQVEGIFIQHSIQSFVWLIRFDPCSSIII